MWHLHPQPSGVNQIVAASSSTNKPSFMLCDYCAVTRKSSMCVDTNQRKGKALAPTDPLTKPIEKSVITDGEFERKLLEGACGVSAYPASHGIVPFA
jgi:hypothetical protein